MATFDNITLEILEDSADKTGLPVRVRIEYNDFNKEVRQSNIEMILSLFLAQEKSSLTPIEFINKVRGAKKEGEAGKKTPDPEKKPELTPDPDPEEESKKAKKKKKKDDKGDKEEKKGTGRIVVRWVAGLLILTSIAYSGYNLYKDFIKPRLDNNDGPDLTPPPGIEQRVDTNEQEQGPISDVDLPSDDLLPYINRGSTDMIAMSEEEFLEALTSQSVACQENMPEISIFLEGGELEGEKHISHIENSFRYQSPDFCIVEYFNQCRNDVVNAAYDSKNRDDVRLIQDIHLKELYLFITNQSGVTLSTTEGEKTFYWNTISDEARNAILDVYFGLVISLSHDHVLSIDGASFTPEQLGQLYEAELARLTTIDQIIRR